jgi:hypothetical protein
MLENYTSVLYALVDSQFLGYALAQGQINDLQFIEAILGFNELENIVLNIENDSLRLEAYYEAAAIDWQRRFYGE